jgi:6-phosphogluconolactonase
MDQSFGRMKIAAFPDLARASQALALRLVEAAQEAVRKNGLFALALSGGSTPRLLYSLLAEKPGEGIPWEKTHLFWGDERCVPKNDPQSNYHLAEETLVSRVPIPRRNIHRIPAELKPPQRAARDYEKTLRRFFEGSSLKNKGRTFDVILLGVGPDGHTASLFPGSPVLKEKSRWTAAVDAPPSIQPPHRITLTLPAINGSDRAFFLVAGEEKREIVAAIFQSLRSPGRLYPAAMVRPGKEAVWFVDRGALPPK